MRLSGDFDATGTWTPNALDPGTFSSTLTVKLEIDLNGDHHQQLITAKALKLTATDLTSFPPSDARWESHQPINLVSRSDGGLTESFWGDLGRAIVCAPSAAYGIPCAF